MRFGLREIVFILVLLAVPVASFFLVFKPRNDQIREARAEILAKQAKLRQLEEQTVKYEDLGREIEKIEEAIRQHRLKLPEQREVEVILKQVWELATKQKLNPRSVRTDKPVKTGQYAELPIPMTITGDFDSFYVFLQELEKLSRITRMPNMKLVKAQKAEGQMKAEIVLSVFYENAQGGS